MTKKQLNWRLKDLPDAVDVAELVDKKVITPEEARQLLFNEGKDEGKKFNELEEEVRFLRELCDKLAAKTSGGWTTVVHEYRDYSPKYPTWYRSYGTVINAINTTGFINTTTGTSTIGSTNTMHKFSSSAVGNGAKVLNAQRQGLSSLN